MIIPKEIYYIDFHDKIVKGKVSGIQISDGKQKTYGRTDIVIKLENCFDTEEEAKQGKRDALIARAEELRRQAEEI